MIQRKKKKKKNMGGGRVQVTDYEADSDADLNNHERPTRQKNQETTSDPRPSSGRKKRLKKEAEKDERRESRVIACQKRPVVLIKRKDLSTWT